MRENTLGMLMSQAHFGKFSTTLFELNILYYNLLGLSFRKRLTTPLTIVS